MSNSSTTANSVIKIGASYDTSSYVLGDIVNSEYQELLPKLTSQQIMDLTKGTTIPLTFKVFNIETNEILSYYGGTSWIGVKGSVAGYLTANNGPEQIIIDLASANTTITPGYVLTATSPTSADWLAPTGGGGGFTNINSGKIVGRTTAGLGPAEEISVVSPLSLASLSLSIPQATTSISGYLTNTDWNTFNNKANSNQTFYLGTTNIAINRASGVLALTGISIDGSAGTSANLTGGAAGSIPYQSAPNITVFLTAGTGVLVGGTTPSYSTTPTLTGTNFSGIPNSALVNSSLTIGSTNIALGGTSTTLAGLTSVTSTSFIGNLTGNADTVTTNANLSGDVSSIGNVTTIGTNKVTLSMMQQQTAPVFLGRTTVGLGNVEALTPTQATAMLNTFGTNKGLVPGVVSSTTQFLRADGSFAVPPLVNLTDPGYVSPADYLLFQLDNFNRIEVADADFVYASPGNAIVAITSLTATRTMTVPAAALRKGQQIWIVDESGQCSGSRLIRGIFQPGDTLSGGVNTALNFPYGAALIMSDGSNKWTVISTTSLSLSAGVTVLPSVTDNGDGTITVSSGVYALFPNSDGSGRPKQYPLAGGTFALTDGVNSYLVVDYNNGTPVMSVTNNVTLINETTVIPVQTMFRQGLQIHSLNWDQLGNALSNKLNKSIVKTQRFRPVPGGYGLGEAATRLVTIGAGTTYIAAVEHTDIALTSATTPIQLWYHSAGVWTYTTVSQYNNTQYDDGTNLVTLNPNRYAVNFIYRSIGNDDEIFITLGQDTYTLGGAQIAQPQSPPPVIAAHAMLIGKIIVEQGASTATQIDSAFNTLFTPAGVTDHNSLANLQGGAAGEFFHFTSAQYIQATQIASASLTGLLSSTDWSTFNAKAPTNNPIFTGTITTSNIDSPVAGTLTLGAINATVVNLGTGSGTQTVNIGTGAGTTTINLGGSGDTVNIAGTLTYVNTTNLQISDKLITLNKGGAVSSGDGSGIEVEENSIITGYFKIGNTRASWVLSTPAKSGTILLTPSASAFSSEILGTATVNRVYTLPDKSDTFAMLSDLTGGTVTTLSVVSANGFAGSVANPTTTPAITLTTTITGILKGNGTAISAATAGTDYVSPNTLTIGRLVAAAPTSTTGSITLTSGSADYTTTPTNGDLWNNTGVLKFYNGSATKTLAFIDQTFFLGTTSIAINRSSGAIVLTGITSIDGNAATSTLATNATNSTISNDTTNASTVYPTWVTANTGNLPLTVSSTKLSFVPSTGTLSATVFSGSGAGLTNIPNGALTNSSITVGSTNIALGATSTTLAGLTSVSSTTVIAGTSASVFTGTLTTTAVTAGQVIISISAATYRSAEFIIQGVDVTGTKYQTTKMLVIHNGTTVDYTEYGSVQLGGNTGSFSADYNAGNIRLLVTPASTNSTVFNVTCIANAI